MWARCLVTTAILAGCGGKSTPKHNPACFDPVAFGAVVDDGKDDRAALQAAIDAATASRADVCLPAGDLHVTRRPPPGARSIPSLVLAGTDTGIRGVGDRSRLVMLDQGAEKAMRDWWVLQISGSRHVLREFAMDGTSRGITNEQTHLIQILGPADDITIDRVRLTLPEQSISRGGDCIRMLGEATTPVHDVHIHDSRGEACARSFIAFQRYVSRVVIERVKTTAIGGGAIDMEPTGDGSIHSVVIRTSDLHRGPVARGGFTVALAGTNMIASRDVVLEDSTIEAGIWVYNVHGAQIRRNSIYGGVKDRGLIKVVKDSRDVVIEDNVLERSEIEGDGVEITGHNGKWPSNVVIRNNKIKLRAPGFPIRGESVEGIEVVGNRLTCNATTGRYAAVYLRGVVTPITRTRIRHNQIRGNCAEAVRIAQHANLVTGETVIEDNEVEGTEVGVTFENGAPSVRPVIDRNVFRGVAPAQRVMGTDRKGFAGSNSE